jgi:hypothetical protein
MFAGASRDPPWIFIRYLAKAARMSVILVDLGDDKHDLQINWWNWRPILTFLREGGLIDGEQFERMGANASGGELSAEQAGKVAAFVRSAILPRLANDQRIHLNGEVSDVPQQPRPIQSSSTHELYAACKPCLEVFAAFCESSKGFEVL